MKYDERGRELPDPTPVEVPVHLRRRDGLQDQIRRLIRTELSRQAAAQGMESFEEADDFEVDGEAEDFVTQYEMTEMQEERSMAAPEPKEAGDDGEGEGNGKPRRQNRRGRGVAQEPEAEEGADGAPGTGEADGPAKGPEPKAPPGGKK